MIIIGGKEYNLQFTMQVWDRMENEICMVEEFDEVMMQKGRLRKVAKLVSIMSVEKADAEEIIVAHNHPSGNPTPSKADIAATAKLKAGAELVGLTFIDHLIIGSPDSANGFGFVSMAEELVV